MADVRPFRGIRFDPKRVSLTRALCPPYDVIGAEQARALRKGPDNAIHLELPEGQGEARFSNSAKVWERWRGDGSLVEDAKPAFYVCEERFTAVGRKRRRVGFLAALGVTDAAARKIMPHERTLAKPKEERLKLLRAVRANISPIFGVFPDDAGAVRSLLGRAMRRPADAAGTSPGGVAYRLWRADAPELVRALARALKPASILIADGHHRFEVSRTYWKKFGGPGADTILAYLCPEQDPGLVMLPTHRVVAAPVPAEALKSCELTGCGTRRELLERLDRESNPYAFGLAESRYHLAVPRANNGCRSGLCVEWVARSLLAKVPPERIRYTPDAAEAVELARKGNGSAVLIKAAPVSQVRKAVQAVGLLPPKSTYFFPKIATGLVFKALA